jgi:hypothetical protein
MLWCPEITSLPFQAWTHIPGYELNKRMPNISYPGAISPAINAGEGFLRAEACAHHILGFMVLRDLVKS